MSEPFLGQIELFAFNYPPRDWAFCNGALMGISQNAALFSLLSDNFGGNARTTFGLPNLTSRAAVGFNMGNNRGLFAFPMGLVEGQQRTTLSQNELATHSHVASFVSAGGDTQVKVKVTTDTGNLATVTNGAYLAAPSDLPGQDKPEEIFKHNPSPGSLVSLGGMTGGGGSGSTSLEVTGSGHAFNILNPMLGLNFSIALLGDYPPRN